MIAPELAALTTKSLAAFALKHTRSLDDKKRLAAGRAYVACTRKEFDKARKLLSRAGLVPEAPSLLPAQQNLLDGIR